MNNSCMNQNTSRDALLHRVYETGLSVDDVVLYLDTHPCDRDALNYYNCMVDLLKQATAAYEAQCGPLTAESVRPDNYWTWVENPWPWEGVCG